jgi:acetylglutamate kinase
VDYGFVGDIDIINVPLFKNLLSQDISIVMAPITHDKNGQLLNTNADTIAQEIAKGLAAHYDVSLIYSFEKAGVLLDANDNETVIRFLTPGYYSELKDKNLVFAGMLPKLDNAFAALDSGVTKVIIGQADQLEQLIAGNQGTTIINE